jgi:hypothetical protein
LVEEANQKYEKILKSKQDFQSMLKEILKIKIESNKKGVLDFINDAMKTSPKIEEFISQKFQKESN